MELITSVGGCNAKEFASQLTLFEWNLYRNISIKELCEYSNRASGQNDRSPSIQSSIMWFNTLAHAVIIDVLKPDIKQRIEIIEFWIKVGHYCRKLNNFNGVMEIIGALSGVPISRLQLTWNGISKKSLHLFHSLEQLMSTTKNYDEYRSHLDKLHSSKQPAVPYLGLFLRDMVFIGENPSVIQENDTNNINQYKVDKERHLITNVVTFQERSYKVHPSPKTVMILEQLKKSKSKIDTDNGLYERSLLMEPPRKTIHNDVNSKNSQSSYFSMTKSLSTSTDYSIDNNIQEIPKFNRSQSMVHMNQSISPKLTRHQSTIFSKVAKDIEKSKEELESNVM